MVLVPLNLVMIPAIIVQGGHNLVDLIGGGLVFALALMMASATADLVERKSAPVVVD